jgi:hypothetical protein
MPVRLGKQSRHKMIYSKQILSFPKLRALWLMNRSPAEIVCSLLQHKVFFWEVSCKPIHTILDLWRSALGDMLVIQPVLVAIQRKLEIGDAEFAGRPRS